MKKILILGVLSVTFLSSGCLTTNPYNSQPDYREEPIHAENYGEPMPPPPVYRNNIRHGSNSMPGMPVTDPMTNPGGAPMQSPSLYSDEQLATPQAAPSSVVPNTLGGTVEPAVPTGPRPNPSHRLVPKPIAPAPTG